VSRAVYMAGLMIATGGLTYGYLAWSGTDPVAFFTGRWAGGLLGTVVSGALLAGGVTAAANRRRRPRPFIRRSVPLTRSLAWEGLLYGAAEGLLLSALPVLAAWQSFHRLGWTGTTPAAIGSGALAILASVAVIWTHHLGYREFRKSREMLMPILGCGVLSLAYLVTRNPLAPLGGHILLHAGMQLRGIPMPPYSKGLADAPEEAKLPVAA
jgi:hypothetical protein